MATNAPLQKIAGLQSIIPQFDNTSAVTPTFFIDNFEKTATLIECTDAEKLLILKSRIRGEALSQLINSPDLSQEDNYENFKTKFLSFFDKKISLATRQQQFSNCRMEQGESVKLYAARVSLITQKFFNNPDLSIPSVKTLFEQSKLSKFLEGLLPEYKHPTLMKDPQTFSDAVDFAELLEANRSCFPEQDQNFHVPSTAIPVNTISDRNSNQEIKSLLEEHAKQTRESICKLSEEVERLKLYKNNNERNPSNFNSNYKRSPDFSGNLRQNKSFPACQHCGFTNHASRYCYYKKPDTQRQFQRQNIISQVNNTTRESQGQRDVPRQIRYRENSRQEPLNGRRGNA